MLLCMMFFASEVTAMASWVGAGSSAAYFLGQHVMKSSRRFAYQQFGRRLQMSQRLAAGDVLDEKGKEDLNCLTAQAGKKANRHKWLFAGTRTVNYTAPLGLAFVAGGCFDSSSIEMISVLTQSEFQNFLISAAVVLSTSLDALVIQKLQQHTFQKADKIFSDAKSEIVEESLARKKSLKNN